MSAAQVALTVAVLTETRKRLGLSLDYVFEVKCKRLVPVGINVIDERRIDEAELEEEIFVTDRKELAVNVNTSEDRRASI